MEKPKVDIPIPGIEKKLMDLQNELKAPKNQRNEFGGYMYRSCEDILEAVKPLLNKHGLLLFLTDDIVQIGQRYYVKSVAMIRNIENIQQAYSVTAYAREEEVKKGMDTSQITGAASSYARKYALNGLFLIDDAKDSDATNTHGRDIIEPKSLDGTTTTNKQPTSQPPTQPYSIIKAVVFGLDCAVKEKKNGVEVDVFISDNETRILYCFDKKVIQVINEALKTKKPMDIHYTGTKGKDDRIYHHIIEVVPTV